MKLKVIGQCIKIKDPMIYVSDTENVYEVEYEFSSEWDGYVKTAVFKGNGYNVDVVLIDNKCHIPNEVIAESGYIQFGVYGAKTENGVTKRYPTVYSTRMFVDIGCKEGTDPLPPTPDVYAQILEAYEDTNDRIDEIEGAVSFLDETKIGDAPIDNKQYARKNGAWEEVIGGGGGGAVDDVQVDGVSVLQDRIANIVGMASKVWVNAQGFIKSLEGYATEAWVLAKNYITMADVEAKNYTTMADVEAKGYALDTDLDIVEEKVTTIEGKIPSQASSSNQLADKQFVNSSITTNTAFFRGTWDLVNDLHLTAEATEEEIVEALATVILTVTNNDYAFVFYTNATTGITEYYDRYKYSSEDGWAFEFRLNNSSFTAEQWSAINSGITSGKVALIDTAVQDVKINGASIKEDGIANIPIMKSGASPALGVGYPFKDSFDMTNGGQFQLKRLTDTSVPPRYRANYHYTALTLSRLDDYLRYAMTDGVGQAWTDEEKASARERMGAGEPLDVKINGSSIVSNGVANIPILITGTSAPTAATVADFVGQFYQFTNNYGDTETYECIAIDEENETYTWTQHLSGNTFGSSANGYPYLYKAASRRWVILTKEATVTAIKNRNSIGSNPSGEIQTGNYDQAVKHALCDEGTASGDTLGKPLIYTDEEKASARGKIGCSSIEVIDWEAE